MYTQAGRWEHAHKVGYVLEVGSQAVVGSGLAACWELPAPE